jgi:hypothetical protein
VIHRKALVLASWDRQKDIAARADEAAYDDGTTTRSRSSSRLQSFYV